MGLVKRCEMGNMYLILFQNVSYLYFVILNLFHRGCLKTVRVSPHRTLPTHKSFFFK